MTHQSIATAALAAVLLGATPYSAPLLVYSAPAGERPAGADALLQTTAILPNGRIASPTGKSVFVGTNPLGLALSPDGRFAILSNDQDISSTLVPPRGVASLASGYSLSVVDTSTMSLVSQYRDPSAAFFKGVVTARNPRDPSTALVLASDGPHGVVRTFNLDSAGQLTPQGQPIALPSSGGRKPFPAGIAIAQDGRTAFVADSVGNAVSSIDLASGTVTQTVAAGYAPLSVAAAGDRVLVTAGGLGSYRQTSTPARIPTFAVPAFDPNASSSIGVFDGAATGRLAPASIVPMDPAPDGTQTIGGADPDAIVVQRDGQLAYVALANVDRVAVVSLQSGAARVLRGLDLRLYPDAPYGAQPSAEVLSRDGKRLYVALAGLNAVAVLDARTPTRYRYGLIPTAWYPTALAMSPNGRYLYVASAKGVDGWGLLSRVDLKHTSLVKATMATLRFNRVVGAAKTDAIVPPLRSGKRSQTIDRVVYISVDPQTYDSVFGDLKDAAGAPLGNGDASLVRYPQSVTPNLHALARTYAVADNFYAADADEGLASSFATSGDAPLYANLIAGVRLGRGALGAGTDDPEDFTRAGSLFNALSRAGLTYRDYGGLLDLSGLYGGLYHIEVPGLATLRDNVDTAYSPALANAGPARLAQEFSEDMTRYAAAGAMPNFTYVRLTSPIAGNAGETDRAVGTIVDFLSHRPQWQSTAVFVVPEGAAGSDHVNAARSYALVISPSARRGYVGHAHLYTSGIVKTEEELFGLLPLSLSDLLATDLADFFSDSAVVEPYQAIR